MDACNITKRSVLHSLDFVQVEDREYELCIISCLSSFFGSCIAQQMEKFHQQLKSVPCHLPSHGKKRIVVRKSSTFQGIDTCPVMQMLKDSFYSRPVYFYFICPSNVQSGILAVKIGQKIIHLCGRKIRSSSHSRAKAAKDASVISTSIPADFLWNNLIYFFTSVQSWLPAVQA